MTLPASGTISMSQVANELGLANAGINLNHVWVRALAQKASGSISLGDLHGKSGRFDGSVSIGASQSAFGPLSGNIFSGVLAQLGGVFNGLILTEVYILFQNLPYNYSGNFRLYNNTVGQSCVLFQSQPGSTTWANLSPPGSIIRPVTTDNFTILPSN